MSNISEEKRKDLINKVKSIRDYILKSEQDENTENLLKYISDIEKDIKTKKFGLVFEEHKESIDEILESNIPVLSEEKDLFIDNGENINFLIEGDNLASLQLLEKTHKGKVDVIYIDPPYNTGNKDFIYDDTYIDNIDTFRHSKWLSFIKKRLILARKLLSESGVILISIDDNEKSQLKLLCDSIFGENNNLGVFIVKSTPNARDYGYIGKQHEYMLFYCKDSKFVTTNMMPDLEKKFKYEDSISGFNIHPLYNSNEAFTNQNRPNLYYPFYLNPNNKDGEFYEISLENKDGWIEIYPPKSVKNNVQFVWRWGKEKSLLNLNKEIVGYCNGGTEYRIVQKMRHSEKIIRSILDDPAYTTRRGTAEVESIMGNKDFPFPKPLKLIRDVLFMASKDDSIILDFFAGSGSTGHAVMQLNKEDNGKRKYILCTNNENNICKEITYERLNRVINNENYNSSLKYFKVDYLPISDKLYYEYADDLLKYTKELVELENAINFDKNETIKIVLTNEELDELTSDLPESCKTIYLSHNVLTTGEQEKLFEDNGIEIRNIPDYYYKNLVG